MEITILLIALLFFVGLLNIYFSNKPAKKSPTTAKASAILHAEEERSGTTCGDLKRVFATFDKDGDGFITKEELKESLKNLGISVTKEGAEELVTKVDSNGDGLIDFDEFTVLCEEIRGNQDHRSGEDELKKAFDVFDVDKDGLISVEELGSVLASLGLKEGKQFEDCKEMIKKVDMDGDGMVDFDEFKLMMITTQRK